MLKDEFIKNSTKKDWKSRHVSFLAHKKRRSTQGITQRDTIQEGLPMAIQSHICHFRFYTIEKCFVNFLMNFFHLTCNDQKEDEKQQQRVNEAIT